MATRTVSAISAVAVGTLGAAWLALTWDAWLTNFQVRWMCDEDRPFVLLRRAGVESLAIPDDALRRDERAARVFGEAYPVVAGAGTPEGKAAGHALVELWPKPVRSYWGYGVVRTELSVIERGADARVLGTTSLYRRVERDGALWPGLRARLSPPAEACMPSDRIEFVRRVLRPPA